MEPFLLNSNGNFGAIEGQLTNDKAFDLSRGNLR
jgi:hypothetical protein